MPISFVLSGRLVSYVGLLGLLGVARPGHAQGTLDISQGVVTRPAASFRFPWTKPDSVELAAHAPASAYSVRNGITLTAAQEQAMAQAREHYRPQLHAVFAQWQTAVRTQASTAAVLQDSVEQILAAQRAAVLAVLTAAQRTQYEVNEQGPRSPGER